MNGRLLAVLGATGSGKTGCAVRLCRALGGEVVSVDSAQVFRGLDIGTAKPTAQELALAPHHVIDVIDPDTQWSAAAFAAAADQAIEAIRGRGHVPILCGGAGLWYRALTRGVFAAPAIDEAIRAEVRASLDARGAPAVHAELALVDPVAASRLHPNDRQRIGRALEFHRQTGLPISGYQDAHGFSRRRYEIRAVAFDWQRDTLATRLEARARAMFDAGLIAEVEALLATGLAADSPGLSCIGYKQVVALLAGDLTEDQAFDALLVATRRYAKRQRSWFRSEPEVTWLQPEAQLETVLAALTR